MKKNIYKLSFAILLTISQTLFFVENVFAADSYVFLKNPSGVLIGRITYENNSIINLVKINAFCAYLYVAQGGSCEYVDSNSPLANDPQHMLRDVGVGGNASDNFGWVRGAIGAVSNRLDGFIKAVTFYNPEIKEPQAYVVPLGTTGQFQQQTTPVIQTPANLNPGISQAPVNIPSQPTTQPISQPVTEPSTNGGGTGNGQPQIVYQVIERAVPGPQGPAGPQGPQGPAGSGYSVPSVSFPGTAQFNGYVSSGQGVVQNGDATFNNLTANNGNITNLSAASATLGNLTASNVFLGSSTISTNGISSSNATFTSATITNLYASNLSLGSSI
jgi:hypothetical protein